MRALVTFADFVAEDVVVVDWHKTFCRGVELVHTRRKIPDSAVRHRKHFVGLVTIFFAAVLGGLVRGECFGIDVIFADRAFGGYPEVAGIVGGEVVDVVAPQAQGVVAGIDGIEYVSVVKHKTRRAPYPHEAVAIFRDADDCIAGKSVFLQKTVKAIVALCRGLQHHEHQYQGRYFGAGCHWRKCF